MAIGPQDYIDQMLAKKYSSEKVNNIEDMNRLGITKDRYWEIQKDIAEVQRTLLMVSNKMKMGASIKKAASPA